MKQPFNYKKELARNRKNHARREIHYTEKCLKAGYEYQAKPFSFSIPFKPHLGIFKLKHRSVVTFDPMKCKAVSYDWWTFVKVIKNKVVFNTHSYSVTTTRHQSLIRELLTQLGIRIDIELDTHCSLDATNALDHALGLLYRQIEALQIACKRKGARKDINEYRTKQIADLKTEIITIKKLGAKITKNELKLIKTVAITNEKLHNESVKRKWLAKASERQENRTHKQLNEVINGL